MTVENASREQAATLLTKTWDGARKITFAEARARALRKAEEEAAKKKASKEESPK